MLMYFEGMWKGVALGFSALAFVFIMFLKVFSKIMPGDSDEGEEITPQDM